MRTVEYDTRTLFIKIKYLSFKTCRKFGIILLRKTQYVFTSFAGRKVGRYQGSNQKSLIVGQTLQWPNENGEKDKQCFTKHYYTEN